MYTAEVEAIAILAPKSIEAFSLYATITRGAGHDGLVNFD